MVDNLNSEGPFLATFKSGIFVISQVRYMSGICQGFICLDMRGHTVHETTLNAQYIHIVVLLL